MSDVERLIVYAVRGIHLFIPVWLTLVTIWDPTINHAILTVVFWAMCIVIWIVVNTKDSEDNDHR